jgi:hypothetical protein
MSEASAVDTGQLLKAFGLMVAGVAFVWWQLRDVSQAQRKAREDRELRQDHDARDTPDARSDREPPGARP